MDFKVVFCETFLEDLERLVRSIAVHNSAAALKLGETIIAASESLAVFPERYPRVRCRPETRRFIVKTNFKVFYRVIVDAKTVEILRCWDGRQAGDPRIGAVGE
jgi:plasmid stabilization system protein ParE